MELRRYRTAEGGVPYSEWLGDLDDSTAGRVAADVDRMKSGNFGKSEPVGQGVSELKIDFGPGYRVYHLRDRRTNSPQIIGGEHEKESPLRFSREGTGS